MYFRLSVGGSLGTSEKWTINPAYDVEGETGDYWDNTRALAMVTAAKDVVPDGNLKNLVSSAVGFGTYRLEGRNSDSHALLGVAEVINGNPQVGTSTAVHPPQTCVAVSLRTGVAGASGRGRLYVPALGATINATSLRISTPATSAIATSLRKYLLDIQNGMIAAGGGAPWVTLKLALISKRTGVTHHINSVQVGDVLDNQRRRRDRLRETYSALPYPS